jgi:hypothetical protein
LQTPLGRQASSGTPSYKVPRTAWILMGQGGGVSAGGAGGRRCCWLISSTGLLLLRLMPGAPTRVAPPGLLAEPSVAGVGLTSMAGTALTLHGVLDPSWVSRTVG